MTTWTERTRPTDRDALNAFLEASLVYLAGIPVEEQRRILAQTEVNPLTGIKTAKRVVPSQMADGVEYMMNLTEIPAGGLVPAHFHDQENEPSQGFDIETYRIGSGIGIFHTGIEKRIGNDDEGLLFMNPPFVVVPGTNITIPAHTVHELRGIRQEDVAFVEEALRVLGLNMDVDPLPPVQIAFSCPPPHIGIGYENRRHVDTLPRIYRPERIPGTVFVDYPQLQVG